MRAIAVDSQKVAQIVEKTMMNLTYDFVLFSADRTPETAFEADPDLVSVGIEFEGPLMGKMFLTSTMGVAVEIAGNMMGISPEGNGSWDDPEYRKQVGVDALKECLNVICGTVLPSLRERYGSLDLFMLHSPFVVQGSFKELLDTVKAEGGIVLTFVSDFNNSCYVFGMVVEEGHSRPEKISHS